MEDVKRMDDKHMEAENSVIYWRVFATSRGGQCQKPYKSEETRYDMNKHKQKKVEL